MENVLKPPKQDLIFVLSIITLTVLSTIVLRSIEPSIYPNYYIYLVLGFVIFYFFSRIDFIVISAFYKQLFYFSLFLLILPLLIGQVTRGAVRWIPIGSITLQPSEIVRPLLLVFFAKYVTLKKPDHRKLLKSFGIFLIPFFLILVQPSLGIALITGIGFLGIILSADFPKKQLLILALVVLAVMPIGWTLLAPYQQLRVITFLDPAKDPLGAGYNSIQSMISVGAGGLTGRGLGKGIQTQLHFLPEKHTDFIFAAVSEEMGFIGAIFLIIFLFLVFWRMISFLERAKDHASRAYMSGFILMLLAQSIIHIAMNMALLPITGVPLPLVSAGGSSFLATMMGLGIAVGARKV